MEEAPSLWMREVLGSGELDEIFGRGRAPATTRQHRLHKIQPELSNESADSLADAPPAPEASCLSRQTSLHSSSSDHDLPTEAPAQFSRRRVSRPRELVRRLRERATSFKNELSTSFKDRRGSEPSSRRTSVPEVVLGSSHDSAGSSEISQSSPSTSPEICLRSRNSATQSSLPTDLDCDSSTMPAPRQSTAFLDPAAISRHQQLTAQKARTTNIAQEEEAFIRGRLRKKGLEHTFPQYRFIDFIGRGTYGRVFHALDLKHKPPRDVAVKLMNLDDVDYKANGVEKDETLKDVKNEINILSQLKDARARNVNLIYDVLEVDGHLWIICEHCPGGSLRTLLRASQNKCSEKYIRIVARELAIGLASIHGANVIHRDLKAANVMIHEQGHLQIIDFGVAGAVESKTDKRMTFIGTPYWMAPEQHMAKGDAKYGFEVDIWAYAITLYEIATGSPPLVQLPPNRLAQGLRRSPPRLSEDKFSSELCHFFDFVAKVDADERPSIQDILQHPYIRGSEQEAPTHTLKELVDKFLDWSLMGGQRTSLFLDSGAQPASDYASNGRSEEIEFIFSTSRDLAQEYEFDASQLSSSPPGTMIHVSSPTLGDHGESRTPRAQDAEETKLRAARGGQALEALFDASQDPYEYNVRSADMVLDRPIISRAKSDLPLRNIEDASSSPLTHKEVDYSDASSSSKSDVELVDADTIKQKRKQPPKRDTMGWQPDWGNIEENMSNEPEDEPQPLTLVVPRPPLVHADTAPGAVAQARASVATLNLDDMMGDDDWISSSALGSSFTSLPTPLQSEETKEDSFDSYASSLADVSASEDEVPSSSFVRRTSHHPDPHAEIESLNPLAMMDGAPTSVVESEVTRLLSGFMAELSALADEFPREDDLDSDTESEVDDRRIIGN